MPRLSQSGLEGLRSTIRPEYAGLTAGDLERVVESSIAGLSAGTAEDFVSTLSSIGKTAAPLLQRAAPDVAQGAATGATFGPYGAIIGAGAGLVSSLIKSQQKSPPAAKPAAPVVNTPPPPPPASVAPQPPAAAIAGTSPPQPSTPAPAGQGAAATLLSLFQNPTVQQALLSQALGSVGNQQVQTESGTSLPRGAINAVLSQLLNNASDALAESESISEQSYLQDATGEYLVDPASLDQHAALILSHLQSRAPAEDHSNATKWDFEDVAPLWSSEEWPEVDEGFEAVSFY